MKTPGNARLLRQNGPVLWICRPLEALTVGGGRPLSSSREALEKMEAERLPLYRAAARRHCGKQRQPEPGHHRR